MRIKQYKGGSPLQRYQGDISILQVDKAECEFSQLPEEGIFVGHSESGHNHRVVKERGAEVEFGHDKEGYFIKVKSGTASIVHEKAGGHEVQVITPGLYFFGKQWEYDEREDRKVID